MTEYGIHVHDDISFDYNEQLNDCRLITPDGSTIPANIYVMTTSCGVLHTCFKDTSDRDFHIDADPDIVEILVNLLHGKRVKTWSLENAVATLELMDYLNCHASFVDVVDIVWDSIIQLDGPDEIFHALCTHAMYLAPTRLRAMVRVASTTMPKYSGFREIFKNMTMTPNLARALMDVLMETFSPLHVFYDIVASTDVDHQYDVAMSILTIPNIGIGFHPDEFHVALRSLYDISPVDEYSTSLLLKSCLDAFGSVNHPSVSSKVWGSFLSYRGPRASYLLNIMRQPCGKQTVRFHGCHFVLETSSTVMDIESTIYLEKLTYDDIDRVDVKIYVLRHQRDMMGVIGPVSKVYDFEHQDDRVFSLRTIDPLNWGKISFSHRINDPETVKFVRIDITWTS